MRPEKTGRFCCCSAGSAPRLAAADEVGTIYLSRPQRSQWPLICFFIKVQVIQAAARE